MNRLSKQTHQNAVLVISDDEEEESLTLNSSHCRVKNEPLDYDESNCHVEPDIKKTTIRVKTEPSDVFNDDSESQLLDYDESNRHGEPGTIDIPTGVETEPRDVFNDDSESQPLDYDESNCRGEPGAVDIPISIKTEPGDVFNDNSEPLDYDESNCHGEPGTIETPFGFKTEPSNASNNDDGFSISIGDFFNDNDSIFGTDNQLASNNESTDIKQEFYECSFKEELSAVNRSSPSTSIDNPHSYGCFPNLTIHFPPRQRAKELNDPVMTLFESCCRSKVRLKIDSINKGKKLWTSSLYMENKLIFVGRAQELYHSKTVAAQAALRILVKRNSYRTNTIAESFLLADEIVPGLTLFLGAPSPNNLEASQGILDSSCARCNVSVSWWDDSESSVFGPMSRCTAVLLLNSKPICWGGGFTLEQAKKKAVLTAVLMLKKTHPIVYKNNTINGNNSNNNNNDSISNTGVASQSGTKKLSAPIPGLTLYFPYCGGEYVHHPCSTLQSSALRSKKHIEMKNLQKNKSGVVYATKLSIDDIVVAWGYGKTLKIARNNVWTEALEVLMTKQPIVYDRETASDSVDVPECQPSSKRSRVEEEGLTKELSIWLDY